MPCIISTLRLSDLKNSECFLQSFLAVVCGLLITEQGRPPLSRLDLTGAGQERIPQIGKTSAVLVIADHQVMKTNGLPEVPDSRLLRFQSEMRGGIPSDYYSRASADRRIGDASTIDGRAESNEFQSIVASGAPGEMEARLRRFDGEYRWFLIRAVPFRDETGTIIY